MDIEGLVLFEGIVKVPFKLLGGEEEEEEDDVKLFREEEFLSSLFLSVKSTVSLGLLGSVGPEDRDISLFLISDVLTLCWDDTEELTDDNNCWFDCDCCVCGCWSVFVICGGDGLRFCGWEDCCEIDVDWEGNNVGWEINDVDDDDEDNDDGCVDKVDADGGEGDEDDEDLDEWDELFDDEGGWFDVDWGWGDGSWFCFSLQRKR